MVLEKRRKNNAKSLDEEREKETSLIDLIVKHSDEVDLALLAQCDSGAENGDDLQDHTVSTANEDDINTWEQGCINKIQTH